MAFWKTLGKIGAIAAPLIAAPFTGGASLAALGALSGAAGARLSGRGLKGTLLGAGFGAIPGLSGVGKVAGAATPGLRQGLTQVGRSAIGLGPSTASQVGSEVANVANAVQAVQGPSRLADVGNVLKHLLPMVGGGGGGVGGGNPYGDLGTTASGAAKGSADQRLAEADALTKRYAQSLQGARDQADADLAAAEFKRVEEARAFERALISNQMERGPLTMGEYAPVGFTPSTPTYQNQPGEANAALMAQLAPLQQIEAPTYTLPGAPGVNAEGIPLDLQQGRGEKILGGVGLGAKLLGSVLGNFGRGAGTGPDRGTNLPRFPQAPWDTGTPHLDMETLRASGQTGAPYVVSPPPQVPWDTGTPHLDMKKLLASGQTGAPYVVSPPPQVPGRDGLLRVAPPPPGRVTTRETPRVAPPPPTVPPVRQTYGGRDVSGILGRSPRYWTHTGKSFDPRTGERLDPPTTPGTATTRKTPSMAPSQPTVPPVRQMHNWPATPPSQTDPSPTPGPFDRLNKMFGETFREADRNQGTVLNRMGRDLSPQQRQQMLAANEAVEKLAAGALAIPVAGMAAWAAGGSALTLLSRITPQFIHTATGIQAKATLEALQRMLPSLSDNPRRHAIRQIVELSRAVGGGP